MIIIKAEKVTKKFKDLVAVDHVNLEVEEGECFGLLGPNGAGKTSLTRMLTAVSPPTEGDIWVAGMDLRAHAREIKAILGIVPQLDNLDPDLTVLQNLTTFARYFDIPKAEAKRRSLELLGLFELTNKANSNIRELSGGMKRRLIIARGLINQPKILVLDEPTTGLDPQARHLVWHKLTELKSQGVTQLLCTQNMEEAALLCDRVAIMHQGKILSLDAPQKLVARYVGSEVLEVRVDSADHSQIVKELQARGADFEEDDGRIQVFHAEAAHFALGEGVEFRRRPGTLEDVFFRLTGRSLNE